MTNLLDGRDVPLYGEEANVGDWLHMNDHCRAIHLVVDGGRPGRGLQHRGGAELSNKELTGLLLEAIDSGSRWVQQVDRLGHDLRYSVDWAKIRDELAYRPAVDFEQGLDDVVAWYRDRRDWWEPLKDSSAE